MHADWFDHFWDEPLLQLVSPHTLVPRVDTVIRDILAEIMQQMPVVMQEARHDDLRSFSSLLGEGRALQGMLKFCDVLSVAAMPLGFEDSEDFGDDLVCVGGGHGR
jgi:hypothetical protein